MGGGDERAHVRAPTRVCVNEAMSSAIVMGSEAAAARAIRASAASSSATGRNATAAARVPIGRRCSHVARVAKKREEPGAVSEEEAQYREMLRVTKEWMAYDPDELPENYPAPWETHVQQLMENGPWPCWDPEMDESDFEDPPQFIPFKETPPAYSMFDDKAKIFKAEQREERAELTRVKQAEIRTRPHMSMDKDVRLKDIPSCDETGWTHRKIMHLIDYPEDVQAKMEEHSVHMYDPRWPIDNSWIPPPEPDTWTFLKEIGRGTEEPEEDVKLRARIAAKNGIIQRFDDSEEADAFEYLAGASEAKLQRAVDIGEEDDEEDDGFRTPGLTDDPVKKEE